MIGLATLQLIMEHGVHFYQKALPGYTKALLVVLTLSIFYASSIINLRHSLTGSSKDLTI